MIRLPQAKGKPGLLSSLFPGDAGLESPRLSTYMAYEAAGAMLRVCVCCCTFPSYRSREHRCCIPSTLTSSPVSLGTMACRLVRTAADVLPYTGRTGGWFGFLVAVLCVFAPAWFWIPLYTSCDACSVTLVLCCVRQNRPRIEPSTKKVIETVWHACCGVHYDASAGPSVCVHHRSAFASLRALHWTLS